MIKPETKVFNILFKQAVKLLKDYPIELVAGTLMAIAVRLYRTSLNDQEFEDMMKAVVDTDAEPYDLKKKSIH
jgi:hypothetical protein|tara:strand:+ start:446 stop:664 length:219 start_codon:yes stop_codon:yes gene_type:complete